MTIIRSYQDCAALAATKKRKIDNNTYLVTDDGPEQYHVKLHATRIITYTQQGTIILNSGGWRTSTTKARMSEYSPFQIWQYRGLWTVHWDGGQYPYADGIEFDTVTGKVYGAAPDPLAEIKLRKRVNAYVKDYMDAFVRGEVPPPGPGDCWGCCMKEVGTGKEVFGNDHLLSHMEEKYYVPSMLNNAMQDWAGQCTSQAARQYVSCVWMDRNENSSTIRYLQGIAVPQLKKVLFDYLAHRLGLTPGRTTYGR